NNILIVAVSLAVGIIPISAPQFYHAFPETARIVLDSGISTGCVVAVLLNLVFNHIGNGRREAAEVTHPMDPVDPVNSVDPVETGVASSEEAGAVSTRTDEEITGSAKRARSTP